MRSRIVSKLAGVGAWGEFVAQAAYWLLPAFMRKSRGSIPSNEAYLQIDRLAFGMLPLLGIVLFFVGMILALQLATILKMLGVVEYVADIVGIAMVREMAPLLTGVVLSGFAGAAIAAEIGSMKVGEEIAALESLALPPARFLMAPRLLAAVIIGPLTTTFAIYVGIAGGMLASSMLLGIAPGQYLERTLTALQTQDLVLGLVKGEAFALIVVAIACFQGATTQGGARGVGKSTTSAVVKSIVAIIAADLFLTVLFFHVP